MYDLPEVLLLADRFLRNFTCHDKVHFKDGTFPTKGKEDIVKNGFIYDLVISNLQNFQGQYKKSIWKR